MDGAALTVVAVFLMFATLVAALQVPGLAEPAPARPTVLAVGSCASDLKFAVQPIWEVIAAARPDAVVLLGDTPYIDSTDLDVQRARYRAFYARKDIATLRAKVPFYCTWDDHDFGRDGADGTLPEKANARRAFIETHPEQACGLDGEGVFQRFRHGPVEVFLLDTRWFVHTEPSPCGEGPTVLGRKQWDWLCAGLRASTAPFKVLACGMVWNDAVRPLKTDYWGAFPAERAALFAFLGEADIAGVVLLSGDIHRSRVLRHATREAVGYELTELITSPLAQSVIASADAPHPGLVWDVGVEHTCLVLEASDTVLTARFLQAADPSKPAEMFVTRLFAEHLSKPRMRRAR